MSPRTKRLRRRRMSPRTSLPSRRKSHSLPSKTWLILADVHYPAFDRATFACALDFARHNRLAGVVFLGDQLDNSCISHHNDGKPLLKPTSQYAKDTAGFDRDILTPLERVLPRGCKRVWIIGNHCDWENQLVEKQPELRGTIERPILLRLRQRGWKVIPCGGNYKHGRLTFAHGESLSGAYHAKKAVETYCSNLVYGHFHSLQTHVKTLPYNATQKWIATCLPIIGKTNPAYARNKANSWINGFGIVEFFADGSFDLYTVVVTRGRCAYGGKVYSAQQRRAA